MKKASAKNKGAQGCLKISSYFSKQIVNPKPTSIKNTAVNQTPCSAESKQVINLDSEEEESPSLLRFKPKQKIGQNKRKLDDNNKTNISPPLKKAPKTIEEPDEQIIKSSPQPSTSGLSPNYSTNDINITKTPCLVPSTSGETPLKNIPFKIKSAEKLLTSAALKDYNSPEKGLERFLDKPGKKLTPLKLNFPEKSRKLSDSPKTPNKSSSKNSSGEKSNKDSTPSKSRKTPKKLFDRSPNNINEFNVEVLRNFVKITPSKKEVNKNENIKENKRKSLEIQIKNEKTPVKNSIPGTSQFSPGFKVRTKLNFSVCAASTNGDDKLADEKISKEKTPPSDKKTIKHEEIPLSWEKENIDSNNLSLDIFEEENWDTDIFDNIEYTLDMTESQHCKVVSVIHRTSEIVLTVRSTKTNQQAVCTLQGFWIHSKFCVGDTLHIKATKLGENNWLVDNQNGFLVYEPDLLISTTSIVGSVFCKRKSVLQEKFRGFEPTNNFMIVGNMVHTLLQEVLKNKVYTYKEIDKCAKEILSRKEWVRQIYESGDSFATIEQEFMIYVAKVYEFLGTYVQHDGKKVNPKPYKKDDWKGTISGIDDIEENIWCPGLGLKGKVDVSVRNGLETIPLEVKTGRASVSLQHRGQVLLYIMMMNKLGYRVTSGLLLYLKEGILKEIPPSASEKRDIIILRNELAYFLTRIPAITKNSDGIFLEPGEVPEPIDHPSCSKCSYNTICTAYSRYTNEDLSSKKTLMQVQNNLSNFLTSAHIDYFMRWSSLLHIEMSVRNDQKNIRDIYTLSPEERKNKGRCLINLTITHITEECNGTYLHTFSESIPDENSEKVPNFFTSGFTENTYVVVSVENRPAISTGFVTDISAQSITVSLDRNLNKKYAKQIFFLDTYDSTTFLTFNLASLALILDTSDRSNQLRSIIVDKQPATFPPGLPRALADTAKPILTRLNRVQQRAVLKAIAANEYFLIKGMPGTGKTATIVALIQLLVKLNKNVLITSHTHSAVDNVCTKLVKYGVKLMRLGSEAKIDATLRAYSEHNLTKDCRTPEDLEQVYNEMQVLAVTCLGSGHPVLSKRTMDICIVDESTQVLQCSVFRPLHAAKTFILIGDPDQLPTVVRNKEALELGMSESLFERLNSDESCIALNLNYRMNEPITELANALTYNGELLIGSERIAKATLDIPKFKELIKAYRNKKWLIKTLDPRLKNAVQFVDTGPVWNLNKKVSWARAESYDESVGENQRCSNLFEAAIIYHLVQALITKGGVTADQIGVICTYRLQVAQLVDLLQSTTVDVNTVDQFQGKDKSVVIYSCSKSKNLEKNQEIVKFDLLEDKRRLNVAITRAKHKLIIVGDFATLHNYSTFKKIESTLEKNVIRLLEYDDFNWDDVLNFNV